MIEMADWRYPDSDPHMKRDHLASPPGESRPDPWLVRLVTHETPQCIDFRFNSMNFNRFSNTPQIDVQRTGGLLVPSGDRLEEVFEASGGH